MSIRVYSACLLIAVSLGACAPSTNSVAPPPATSRPSYPAMTPPTPTPTPTTTPTGPIQTLPPNGPSLNDAKVRREAEAVMHKLAEDLQRMIDAGRTGDAETLESARRAFRLESGELGALANRAEDPRLAKALELASSACDDYAAVVRDHESARLPDANSKLAQAKVLIDELNSEQAQGELA